MNVEIPTCKGSDEVYKSSLPLFSTEMNVFVKQTHKQFLDCMTVNLYGPQRIKHPNLVDPLTFLSGAII